MPDADEYIKIQLLLPSPTRFLLSQSFDSKVGVEEDNGLGPCEIDEWMGGEGETLCDIHGHVTLLSRP